jgi:hypothetical protein
VSPTKLALDPHRRTCDHTAIPALLGLLLGSLKQLWHSRFPHSKFRAAMVSTRQRRVVQEICYKDMMDSGSEDTDSASSVSDLSYKELLGDPIIKKEVCDIPLTTPDALTKR